MFIVGLGGGADHSMLTGYFESCDSIHKACGLAHKDTGSACRRRWSCWHPSGPWHSLVCRNCSGGNNRRLFNTGKCRRNWSAETAARYRCLPVSMATLLAPPPSLQTLHARICRRDFSNCSNAVCCREIARLATNGAAHSMPFRSPSLDRLHEFRSMEVVALALPALRVRFSRLVEEIRAAKAMCLLRVATRVRKGKLKRFSVANANRLNFQFALHLAAI
jgi:hypothetical protein